MFDLDNYDVYSQGFGDMTDTEQILLEIGSPDAILSTKLKASAVTEQNLTGTKPNTMLDNITNSIPTTIFGINTGKFLGYAAGAIVLYIIITSMSKKKKKRRKY